MEQFLKNHRDAFSVKVCADGFLLFTPIMYDGADHTFSFHIRENESGSFTIDDRGQTLSYLRENCDPKRYAAAIDAVCRHYGIRQVDGIFYGTLASYASGQTVRTLYKFLGAIHTVANIELTMELSRSE